MQRAVARLFHLIFPDDCRVCGAALQSLSRVPVCQPCLDSVEPLAAEYACGQCGAPFLSAASLVGGVCRLCRTGAVTFQSAYSYGTYDGTLCRLIHLFKYERVTPLAGRLGGFLARAVPRNQIFDVIVPMPLHPWRRFRRGFNQAELLSAELSRRTGLPMVSMLRRRRPTVPQAGLTNAQRRANVRGAFQVRDTRRTGGRHCLLVDDVLTTGATAAAAAAALLGAGARRVSVLTVARADRRAPVWSVPGSSKKSMAAGVS
jgi:ComF family protein